MKKVTTTDEYIAQFPKDTQELLTQIRKTIHNAAPFALEKISYGLPAFHQKKNLVYFGAFRNHISLFPTSSGIKAFSKELRKYKTSKGTIHFSLEKKLPLNLITRIVKFRLKELS